MKTLRIGFFYQRITRAEKLQTGLASSVAALVQPPMTQETRTVPSPSTEMHESLLLSGTDFLDTDFIIDDASFEAAIANATQEFWANFPGEVELH